MIRYNLFTLQALNFRTQKYLEIILVKKLLITLSLIANYAFAQSDSSKALIYLKEKDVVIYVNGKKTQPQKKLQPYATGMYVIKAWAPHYQLIQDTFFVKKGENKFYTKKLTLTESYKIHRKKQNAYKAGYIIPGSMAIASGFIYYSIHNKRNSEIRYSLDRAKNIQKEYEEASTNDMIQEKSLEYDKEKAFYESRVQKQVDIKKQGVIVTSSLAAASLTFYIISVIHKKHHPFTETPLLTRITPSYNPLSNQLCLTIKL